MKLELTLNDEQAIAVSKIFSDDGDMFFTIEDSLEDQIIAIKRFQEDYPDDCAGKEKEIEKMIKDIKDIQDTILTISTIKFLGRLS